MPLTVEGHNFALNGLATAADFVGLIEATTVSTQIASGATSVPVASIARAVQVNDSIAFYVGGVRTSHKVTAVSGGNATITPATSSVIPVGTLVGHAPRLGSGVVEPTGGAPAYARKAMVWSAAAAENLTLNPANKPTFDINGGKSIGGFALWTEVTGGTCLGTFLTNSMESFGSQGTYQLTDADVNLVIS